MQKYKHKHSLIKHRTGTHLQHKTTEINNTRLIMCFNVCASVCFMCGGVLLSYSVLLRSRCNGTQTDVMLFVTMRTLFGFEPN